MNFRNARAVSKSGKAVKLADKSDEDAAFFIPAGRPMGMCPGNDRFHHTGYGHSLKEITRQGKEDAYAEFFPCNLPDSLHNIAEGIPVENQRENKQQ